MTDETSKPDELTPEAKLPRKREGARSFQPGLWLRLVPAGAVSLSALFIVLNTHRVKVSFVFASTRVSLIWVVLLSNVPGSSSASCSRSCTASAGA